MEQGKENKNRIGDFDGDPSAFLMFLYQSGSASLRTRFECAMFLVRLEREIQQEKDAKALGKFKGEIRQRVPAFSAVKINGERAYKLARKGKKVEAPERKVNIYNIELIEYSFPKLVIRTEVSSGTYIRTLGEDIGRELGTGAYLTALRRTKIAEYKVENAKKLEELGDF